MAKQACGFSRLTKISIRPVQLQDEDGKFTVYVRKISARHITKLQSELDEGDGTERADKMVDILLRYALCDKSGELCYGPNGIVDYDVLSTENVSLIAQEATDLNFPTQSKKKS